MAYTDEKKVENYLGTELPSSLSQQILSWVTAVTEWIDNYTGFSFENSASSTRYFDGSGSRELLVDKYHTLESIVTLDVDGDEDVTIDSSGLVQYPLNTTPKDRLYLESSASIARFPSHRNAVKITATWGYSTTPPEEIILAATRLLAHLLQKRLSGGKVSQESLGDYSVSFEKIDEAAELLGVKNILDQYRNLEI